MTRKNRSLLLFWMAWLLMSCPVAFTEASSDSIRLLLPETIYAAQGVESNVYFDNVVLVLNPANYAFDVDCAKGIQQAERWTFRPKAGEKGDFPFTLSIRNQANVVIAKKHSTLRIVDSRAETITTALLIGDSLTHASVYPQRLLDLFNTGPKPVLRLVGTHQPKPESPANRHEGYGGWRAGAFATKWVEPGHTGPTKEGGSPFLYEDDHGARTLDFGRYCAEVNGGVAPGFVTFFLGCNDTFGANDKSIETAIDDMFEHLDALLSMVRDYSATTRIGLIAPVPPAATQDAFGASYQCGQTRWQYRRNQHRVVERMQETYGSREADGLFLIPAYLNLDCVNNYPLATAPWNAHTTMEGSRLNNGVHPAEAGYRQIGDSIYCWMQRLLEP